jgi:hypothetical protein
MPTPNHHLVDCIVSGGQTGVDRAALDAAMELGIPHQGWCPKGRKAEDGIIPPQYLLRETSGTDYAERTRRNAEDSDATLLLVPSQSGDIQLRGGTLLTWSCCQQLARPVLVVRLQRPGPDKRLHDWIHEHQVKILNVAGPRASKAPGLYLAAKAYLLRVLKVPGTIISD